MVVSGTEITEPVSVDIVGETTYVGVPYCYEEYDAEKMFNEITALDGNCSELYAYNDTIDDFDLWNGTGINFEITNYKGYILYCDASTDITWTPSCEESCDSCGGDSGGGDSGGGSGGGGDSGNDEDPDVDEGPNETISINQSSDSFADDLGLTLDGKGEYQWLLWSAGIAFVVMIILASSIFFIPNYFRKKRIGDVLNRPIAKPSDANNKIL
jgi:hypothetical protein